MVYSATEWMAVLANLASGGALLRTLCPSRSGFERSAWELLIWSLCMRQLEGWANGRLEVAQRQMWSCLVVLGSHSAGDGAAVLGMVA
jgi:hypothetical protein